MSDLEMYDDEEDLIPLGDALALRDERRASGKRVRLDPARARLSDTGNAERWAKNYGHRFRMHTGHKHWFVWDETHWRPDDNGEALLSTKEVARDLIVQSAGVDDLGERTKWQRWANMTESSARRAAMLVLAAAEPGVSVGTSSWDADPWALNVLNGTIDLRNGELRAHNPDDLHSKLAPVTYDPEAKCPQFDTFLAEVLPDADLRMWVQRFFGYAMTGIVREHVFPVFWGPVGRNGKGTLIETLFRVLGPYAMPVPTSLIVETKNEQHPNMIAQLLGARLAVAAEIKQSDRLAESVMKSLTGGDSQRARFLGKEFFTLEQTWKLLLQANFKPRVNGGDPALWARMRVVPFMVSFIGREDPTLKARLAAEAPGILLWLIHGCLEWQRRGLGTCKAIEDATNEYREDSDTLGGFIRQCCVRAPDARVSATDIYREYREWAESRGEHPKTQTALGRDLAQMGFEKRKTRTTIIYHGLGILDGTASERDGGECGQFSPRSQLNASPGSDPGKPSTPSTPSTLTLPLEGETDGSDDDDYGWNR